MTAMRADHTGRAWYRRLAFCLCALAAVPIACPAAAAVQDWSDASAVERMLVVTVRERADPGFAVGATPRGYAGAVDYAGGERAIAAAAAIADAHGLREVASWVIAPLGVRCLVFAVRDGGDRAAVIERLGGDPRVRLVQPLQDFATLASATATATDTATAPVPAPVPAYNDPYFGLQLNLGALDGAAAQRWTQGHGVRIAVIDAGVDAAHPDLAGRIVVQRDFVDDRAASPAAERHGTEVAGILAANANNRIGIVGIAPQARVHAYRACWSTRDGSGSARCNSFTLALALAEAIDAGVRIINLSLGGPRDELLAQLVEQAQQRGIVVVAAVPPDGARDGFPLGVRGVVAVDRVRDGPIAAPGVLVAPGRDILTLQPGGGFDYASGSSLAAAQVSGALALLMALRPRLDGAALAGLLARSQGEQGPINACRAVAELRKDSTGCAPASPR